MLLIFINVKKENMIARYNIPWQAKKRNYDQFKKLKWFPLKHKNMISKLIQLVICWSISFSSVDCCIAYKIFPPSQKKKKKKSE